MALSAAFFGVMAFAAKLAARGLSGGEVAFFRFVFMTLFVLLVPSAPRKAVTFQRLDLLFYRGVFGGTAVLLYFLVIAHISVGIATLLNYSSPVFAVAFAAVFLGERGHPRLLLPAAAALAGLGLSAGGGGGGVRLRPPGGPRPGAGGGGPAGGGGGGGVSLRPGGGAGAGGGAPLGGRGPRHPRPPPYRGVVGGLRQLHAVRAARLGAVRDRRVPPAVPPGVAAARRRGLLLGGGAAPDDLLLSLGDQSPGGGALAAHGGAEPGPRGDLPRGPALSRADPRRAAHPVRSGRGGVAPGDAAGGGVAPPGIHV